MGEKIKKTLEQIRREWAKRPVEGPDPHEVEKKFPERNDLWAEYRECVIEGCHAQGLRGEARCKEHHLAWIKEQEAEHEKAEKDRAKKEKSKQWQESQAQGGSGVPIRLARTAEFTCDLARRT